jgi:hypothetical protein
MFPLAGDGTGADNEKGKEETHLSSDKIIQVLFLQNSHYFPFLAHDGDRSDALKEGTLRNTEIK